MNKIIGVSGVAGVGKDTFFQLLSEVVPCKRYALADELKKEAHSWTKLHYGIDATACHGQEKELIRPFLVQHGTLKRKLSNGRHWIEKIHESILKDKFNGFKIITDIRYDDYDNDEVFWLKNELNGVLVHISQYHLENRLNHNNVKVFKKPVNSEEERNDPKLKQKSDFEIEWEYLKNGHISDLYPYVDNFIKWLDLKS
tara:strand:- start:4650 stop:5246 length:597 start_codon:yes stop_codon:yes gene_type:complete